MKPRATSSGRACWQASSTRWPRRRCSRSRPAAIRTPSVPAANCLGGGVANANDRAIARLSRTGERLMENDSYALFVHGTFALTPRWSFTLGGRQSHESKAFTYSEIYPLLPLPYDDPSPSIANDNPSFPQTTLTDEWNTFTPKVGVEFKPTTDVLALCAGLDRIQGRRLQRAARAR